jgi:DNA-binding FadR family transcriptional regulator
VPKEVAVTDSFYSSMTSRPPASLLLPSTSENAARFIRSLIFSGELGPDDRLPSERVLAKHLGISTLTLRIALNSLVVSGYVVTSRGSRGGSRVNDLSSLLACWSAWIRLHAEELDDIFEFRSVVETGIVSLAAQRRTPEELRTIEEADALLGETRSSLFHWDIEFHDALARAAHNSRLEQAMIAVRGEVFLPADQALRERRVEEVHGFHEAIIEAVRDKDAPAAAEHMRNHIRHTRDMIDRAAKSTLGTSGNSAAG